MRCPLDCKIMLLDFTTMSRVRVPSGRLLVISTGTVSTMPFRQLRKKNIVKRANTKASSAIRIPAPTLLLLLLLPSSLWICARTACTQTAEVEGAPAKVAVAAEASDQGSSLGGAS